MIEIKKIPKIMPRDPDSHKGNYGRVLVIAGSIGMTGAACLCSKAVIRAGAGLVTLAIPESLNPIMEVKLTCVMTLPLPQTKNGALAKEAKGVVLEFSKGFDAVIIGPGLSQHPDTKEFIVDLLHEINLPVVLDADGLNAIVDKLYILNETKSSIILTPHPGELARLMNTKSTRDIQINRIKTVKEFISTISQSCNSNNEKEIVLILKGNRSIVINSDKIYINNTGNPGMASGGSGDVLSGIIGAFIAQGFTPFSAAQLGVYIHGVAGDYAAKEKGEISMIATDIIDYLPKAFIEYTKS